MPYESIIVTKKDHIATVTFNRPARRNAITPVMCQELVTALRELDSDADTRVVVLTGAGEGFCAGGDTRRMTGGKEEKLPTPVDFRQELRTGPQQVILTLQRMQKPTIAMVNGAAAGAGFDFACACDLRIASEKARFLSSYIRIGLFPGAGGTWLYPRVMPFCKALEYLYTGDSLDAKEGEKIGFLNKAVPASDLEKETMALARKIAAGPPIAMGLARLQAYKGLGMELEAALEWASAAETITIGTEDHKEGIAAFRDKRPPRFQGK
ncbi:MAG: enoyl-CoA hydratase-related protein [Chloroflexota bacterium]|nr:enoyl-CoA hydratase-related protein [Chloroflexota bacterium]